jgi:hypothetical protein
MTSSRIGPSATARTTLFQPRSIPRGCAKSLATAITAPPATNPQPAHTASALRLICSHAMNSRPRSFNRPVEVTATTRKPHVSAKPMNSRFGLPEPNAANVGRSSSQKSSSLQYTTPTNGRDFFVGSATRGIPKFWHVGPLVQPKSGGCSFRLRGEVAHYVQDER